MDIQNRDVAAKAAAVPFQYNDNTKAKKSLKSLQMRTDSQALTKTEPKNVISRFHILSRFHLKK